MTSQKFSFSRPPPLAKSWLCPCRLGPLQNENNLTKPELHLAYTHRCKVK